LRRAQVTLSAAKIGARVETKHEKDRPGNLGYRRSFMAHLAGNDGKELEDLIATIEGLLVPRGFTVEMDRRVYDDNGVHSTSRYVGNSVRLTSRG